MSELEKKIYIIGTPGGGKTTLADKLAFLTGLKTIHSDEITYAYRMSGEREIDHDFKILREKIAQVLLGKEEYIFEGRHIYDQLLTESDMIIWLDFPFWITMYRIWKRFALDKEQRELYGFWRYVILSKMLVTEQHFGQGDIKQNIENPFYVHNRKIAVLTDKFPQKLQRIKNANQLSDLVSYFTRFRNPPGLEVK